MVMEGARKCDESQRQHVRCDHAAHVAVRQHDARPREALEQLGQVERVQVRLQHPEEARVVAATLAAALRLSLRLAMARWMSAAQ